MLISNGGKDERGGKRGRWVWEGEGRESEFGSPVNFAALPNSFRTHPGFLPHLRQFAPPPSETFAPPEIWSENNISIAIEICMSLDFASPSEKNSRKKASIRISYTIILILRKFHVSCILYAYCDVNIENAKTVLSITFAWG